MNENYSVCYTCGFTSGDHHDLCHNKPQLPSTIRLNP